MRYISEFENRGSQVVIEFEKVGSRFSSKVITFENFKVGRDSYSVRCVMQ